MEFVEDTAVHSNGVHTSDILAVNYNLGVIETSLHELIFISYEQHELPAEITLTLSNTVVIRQVVILCMEELVFFNSFNICDGVSWKPQKALMFPLQFLMNYDVKKTPQHVLFRAMQR